MMTNDLLRASIVAEGISVLRSPARMNGLLHCLASFSIIGIERSWSSGVSEK